MQSPLDASSVSNLNFYRTQKRALDVLVSLVLGSVTLPIALYAMYRIKSEDRGPVLYAAPRVGLGGTVFRMYKFRSMVVDAAVLGGPSTADDDPRLTKAGRSLRNWKVDELPQLLNVLRGEMSLVGPRPQVESDVARYSADERRLLTVKPGITDWASIKFRDEGGILRGHANPDEAYDKLIRPEKLALGLRYVDEQSMGTDVRILLTTLGTVFRRPAAELDP